MTRVKICGITRAAQAVAAAGAGADFIGLVFAPSRRQVDEERARGIAAAVREHIERRPLLVGVFVNAPAAEVNRIAESCGLDRVQLSGDESWGYAEDIDRPVIKAVRVSSGQSGQDVLAELAPGQSMLQRDALCLLDCHVPGSYGGSGQSFDWKVARQVCQRLPVILAGGLTPQNVERAIGLARPWAVDVSSGVESEGVKDMSKIQGFIEAVRRADGALEGEGA